MPQTADGAVVTMLRELDAGNRDAVIAAFDVDAQGIDELSRS